MYWFCWVGRSAYIGLPTGGLAMTLKPTVAAVSAAFIMALSLGAAQAQSQSGKTGTGSAAGVAAGQEGLAPGLTWGAAISGVGIAAAIAVAIATVSDDDDDSVSTSTSTVTASQTN